MFTQRLILDRYKLEVANSSRLFRVWDTQKKILVNRYIYLGADLGHGYRDVEEKVKVLEISCNLLPKCCGVTELGGFYLDPDLPEEHLLILLKEITRRIKQNKNTFLQAFFVKQKEIEFDFATNKNREFDEFPYQCEGIMRGLLKLGWKELGPPFLNKRYNEYHLIQGICFLHQRNTRKNYYA